MERGLATELMMDEFAGVHTRTYLCIDNLDCFGCDHDQVPIPFVPG